MENTIRANLILEGPYVDRLIRLEGLLDRPRTWIVRTALKTYIDRMETEMQLDVIGGSNDVN